MSDAVTHAFLGGTTVGPQEHIAIEVAQVGSYHRMFS
jgi:hypothetical protein